MLTVSFTLAPAFTAMDKPSSGLMTTLLYVAIAASLPVAVTSPPEMVT